MKVCHFRDDFSNAFVTKRQTDRLRREAFGVRRIPALCESCARREAKAPEYGALQTLRAVRLRLCRAGDRRALPPGMTVSHDCIIRVRVREAALRTGRVADRRSRPEWDFAGGGRAAGGAICGV